jgi:uncharacterized protein (TIGR03437 family)
MFKFTPGGTLTTLYSFCSLSGCADGATPYSALLQASDGNFYGTTSTRGKSLFGGTIFKITPGGALTTLYSFCSLAGCADGERPVGGLIQASDGNFYGTASEGGGFNGAGTVFKITPSGVLTTLYSFCSQAGCTDGAFPVTGLIQGSDGNFYGTTSVGGTQLSGGTIFKVTSGGALATLYVFCSQAGCSDGGDPEGALVQASDGSLYGTTYGANSGPGTVFRITENGTLTTLTSFGAGEGSAAALIQASDGNLYGTTEGGGTNLCQMNGVSVGCGTVLKLVPASAMAAPAINPSDGVVSGASFLPGIVPGSWITIYGTNLSSVTDTWANSIINGNLPTSLDGVSVSVGGKPAYIAYISPGQINALAPDAGSGTVTVTNMTETSSAISAAIQQFEPAFFQWGNYAVATREDYSLAVKNGTFTGVTTVPAAPGDVIILWGTGFGPTTPSAPPGVQVPTTTTYNVASPVTVTVGGVACVVYGAALAPGYAGLYQVAIQIPTSLANGDYALVATLGTAQSPSTTLITVQQ